MPRIVPLVAKTVAKARIDQNMTRAQLATLCGCSDDAIGKLERTGKGSLDLKNKVAEVLQKPFADLFPADAERLAKVLGLQSPGQTPSA